MKKTWFSGCRWILALLALVTISLAIWFLGPYVAFGGPRPLEGIGMRVLLIALMLGVALLWLNGWTLSPVFVALLCLLVWHVPPLLGFGQYQPLAPESAHVAAVTVVLALFALYGLIWLLRRMRNDRAFLEKALKFGNKAEPSPTAERLRNVAALMNGALVRLRRIRTMRRASTGCFAVRATCTNCRGSSRWVRTARARPPHYCNRTCKSSSMAGRTVTWADPRPHSRSTGG